MAMTPRGHPASRLEKLVSLALLLSLAVIAAGVFAKQFSFNPAVLVSRDAAPTSPAAAAASERPAWLPSELSPAGTPESFNPDNLYDKIDGKAELYLSSGFVKLSCRRLALKDDPDQWLEWFVYDMGAVPQAFSVFTVQKRSEGQPLDLAEYAYKTQNALYFICGSNYIEAVASSTNEPLVQAMIAAARLFAAGSGGTRLEQLSLLPADHLVAGSQALQTADVFGFDKFKNVYTADYSINGQIILGFVTECADPAAADSLRDAYRAFLIENGGKPAGDSIEIMGAYEFVFSQGARVAGVHAAPNPAAATALAGILQAHLNAKTK
ncbi:MAG: DUF6599 family protein [Verrucomicrobiota bacterium]